MAGLICRENRNQLYFLNVAVHVVAQVMQFSQRVRPAMSIQTSATAEDRRRRRALQLLFIFANLALVEVRVPGVP